MTLYHSMTRARALLFTVLLIGGIWLPAGQALAKVGKGAAVTLSGTPTALEDDSVKSTSARRILVCVPEDGDTAYVGGEGVTAATGIPVPPGSCYSARLLPNEILYGVGSGDVRVQESSS